MTLILMRVFKFALISGIWLVAGLMLGRADDSGAYDLDQIVSRYGRTYHDIFVVNSDEHGLLFRHRDGIAKLSFSELSDNLRELFQPVVEMDDSVEDEEAIADEPQESGGLVAPTASTPTRRNSDFQIDIVQRNRVYLNPARQQSGYHPAPYHYQPYHPYGNCGAQPPVYWPNHWPRYRRAHALVNPYHRAAVLQDFLYTTGLLPLPPGVNVVRLPSPTPWNFR